MLACGDVNGFFDAMPWIMVVTSLQPSKNVFVCHCEIAHRICNSSRWQHSDEPRVCDQNVCQWYRCEIAHETQIAVGVRVLGATSIVCMQRGHSTRKPSYNQFIWDFVVSLSPILFTVISTVVCVCVCVCNKSGISRQSSCKEICVEFAHYQLNRCRSTEYALNFHHANCSAVV